MTTSISDLTAAAQEIRLRLAEEGFDQIAFVRPDAVPDVPERLSDFLDQDWQGDMAWLKDKADRRGDPRTLWPEVRSIIMVGLNYGPAIDPMHRLDQRDTGVISVYAQNRDYHDVIKKRIKRVGRWIGEEYGSGIKVFVDTAPVAEKPLAAAAGIGWQGKHTNLVSRQFGSWLFLGAIFTTMDLPPDAQETDHCGTCSNCLDVCPTNAFPAPYRLDARRCISYLTIEHKGHIDREFRKPMGNRIYGCDDCLAVCPWNKYARITSETAFHPRDTLFAPKLIELVALDDSEFRALFTASPIKRIGRDRFIRNVLIALGNSGDPSAVPVIEARLKDHSPLVRAMAVWALKALAPQDRVAALQDDHLPGEVDSAVRQEWTA